MDELSHVFQGPEDPAAGVRTDIATAGGVVEVYVERGASAERVLRAIVLCVAPALGRFELSEVRGEVRGWVLVFREV